VKLFIVYDDSSKASQQDLALKALCLELRKTCAANYLKTLKIEPETFDLETLAQAIKAEKENSSHGSPE